MITRLSRFLTKTNYPTPYLALDIDQVEANFHHIQSLFNPCSIYYALKANPAPDIIRRLVALGVSFDAASYPEIMTCLEAGADPKTISWGNTIKPAPDISRAWQRGIRLYAFDCKEELAKIAEHAPGSEVFCRLWFDGGNDACPLSAKFGTDSKTACRLLKQAATMGLTAKGVSFHVGSQQTDVSAWSHAIKASADIFNWLKADGIKLDLLNIGGGFPVTYSDPVPSLDAIARNVRKAINQSFAQLPLKRLILEPGRILVADAGVIKTTILLVTIRTSTDGQTQRWVYLDIGRTRGLVESVNQRIAYPAQTLSNFSNQPHSPAVLAGPTCDWSDTIYDSPRGQFPDNLRPGDHIHLLSTGAYTRSCSSIGFNGFPPLMTYSI